MRIYWNLKSIPELAGFSASERRRLWRRYLFDAFHPSDGLVFVAIIVIGTTFMSLVLGFESDARLAQAIGIGLTGGVAGAVMGLRMMQRIGPIVRERVGRNNEEQR